MIQGPGSTIIVDADDFQRTDRGLQWAIKFRDLGGYQVVYIVTKNASGVWEWAADIDNSFDTNIMKYTSVSEWVKQVLVPKLNAWLAKMFTATSNPVPVTPPSSTDPFQLAFAASQKIKIVVNADNTLTASV